MLVYDFEVLKGETVVASKRSIALPNVSAAWTKIANLAKAIDEPGYKIRVRDQAGGIVILIGVAALRCCADAISRRHFEGSWRVGSSLSHGNLSEAQRPFLAWHRSGLLRRVRHVRLVVDVDIRSRQNQRSHAIDVSRQAFIMLLNLHRHADQVGQVAGAHALHHPRPMVINGLGADPQSDADFLAGKSSYCKLHDLALPW